AKDAQGVWGPWGATWSFTAGGPAPPPDVRVEPPPRASRRIGRPWKPWPGGGKAVYEPVFWRAPEGVYPPDRAGSREDGAADLPRTFAANLAGELADTELIVLGPGLDLPNANKAFYRVVAVDAAGKRSGPSDYAVAPRPFVHTRPPDRAAVGAAYRGSLATI